MLSSVVPTSGTAKSGPSKQQVFSDELEPTVSLRVPFSLLVIQGLDQRTQDATKMPPARHPEPEPVAFANEPSADELTFSILCLLRNTLKVRLFVQDTWKRYEDGRINLFRATLTSKVATDSRQRTKEHFAAA